MTYNPEEFWSERLTAWKSSGESINLFCKTNRLSVGSFYKWKKRLLDCPVARGKFEGKTFQEKIDSSIDSFVEVAIPTTPMPRVPNKTLRITTSYGTIIEVPL